MDPEEKYPRLTFGLYVHLDAYQNSVRACGRLKIGREEEGSSVPAWCTHGENVHDVCENLSLARNLGAGGPVEGAPMFSVLACQHLSL